jgi:hypothetical protein
MADDDQSNSNSKTPSSPLSVEDFVLMFDQEQGEENKYKKVDGRGQKRPRSELDFIPLDAPVSGPPPPLSASSSLSSATIPTDSVTTPFRFPKPAPTDEKGKQTTSSKSSAYNSPFTCQGASWAYPIVTTLPRPPQLLSGAAEGADTFFHQCATRAGHWCRHFVGNRPTEQTAGRLGLSTYSRSLVQVPTWQLEEECNEPLRVAGQHLGRPTSNLSWRSYVKNLIQRNFFQIKDSTAVFAVSDWEHPEDPAWFSEPPPVATTPPSSKSVFRGVANASRRRLPLSVGIAGGTAWACQFFVDRCLADLFISDTNNSSSNNNTRTKDNQQGKREHPIALYFFSQSLCRWYQCILVSEAGKRAGEGFSAPATATASTPTTTSFSFISSDTAATTSSIISNTANAANVERKAQPARDRDKLGSPEKWSLFWRPMPALPSLPAPGSGLNYTGIGARCLTKSGKEAIHALYSPFFNGGVAQHF